MTEQLDKRTQKIVNWMQDLGDTEKMRFALNWKRPHSLFNVASGIYSGPKDDLQGVNWFAIHKAGDIGTWSHGGRVRCV